VLTDFILFPFRLLRAFFHYLNFFSLVYSKKPLTTASGPPAKGDEMKRIVLRGKVLDAEKALRRSGEGTPSLVPANWQLIRRGADHSEQTVASHVAAYDLLPGGGIVWTNGFGVYKTLPDGGQSLLTRDNLIETVVAA